MPQFGGIRVINAEPLSSSEQEENRTAGVIGGEVVGNHMDKYFLAEDNTDRCFVFSAIFGGIHLYCYPPSVILNRSFWTIVTSGISSTKMRVPDTIDEGEKYDRCELMCYLPADWQFPHSLVGPVDEQSWPFEFLRSIGGYVQQTGAWLAEDHGLPNFLSDPPGGPYLPGNNYLNAILLLPNEDPSFCAVCISETENTWVNFYLVVPLTPDEAAWKREVGAENSIYYIVGSKALGGDNVLVDYIIDPRRGCAVRDMRGRERVAQWQAQGGAGDSESSDSGEDENVMDI